MFVAYTLAGVTGNDDDDLEMVMDHVPRELEVLYWAMRTLGV